MPIQKLTAFQTEADLEAAVHGALQTAFPLLDSTGFRHQTKFSFKFGRQQIDVDGAKVSAAQARADVIIWYRDRALAVLELKRHGEDLTSEDDEQGISYARMLHPMPPIVVVTNGSEVRMLETLSGNSWNPASTSEEEVKNLFTSAARVASEDLKNAIEVLLGRGSTVWVEAIRQLTRFTLLEMCGRWDQPTQPFVENFLIPRDPTKKVVDELRAGRRVVIVSGPAACREE